MDRVIMTSRKIVTLAIIVSQFFCGCSFVINKTVESRKNGVLLRCKIIKITNYVGKKELCSVKGILYVVNESQIEKRMNLRELSLKINNQVCFLDDKWKQLLFEFIIKPNQVLKYEINTNYAGTIKTNALSIEIVWPEESKAIGGS